METPFQSFVIFAAMRTGSNFLEQSLNGMPGLTCHGEAFNPVFIAYPDRVELLGLSMADRDAGPKRLLDRIRAAPGLNGFRYFPDHDPRVLEDILADRQCAKIILNRNPVESYVSLKIARETGQWKLKDARRLKSARVRFDPAEFEAQLDRLRDFQLAVLHGLQVSGQTAFHLDYDDIGDGGVLQGLAQFLGVAGPGAAPAKSLVPQNPEPVTDKVANPAEMTAALAKRDYFNLSRVPNFEPRRGPSVPDFVAAKGAPLLFMPIRSGPTALVESWLAGLGPPDCAGLVTGFTQSSLRDWMRDQGSHRRFTVLRHPVARAHAAFCAMVLSGGNPELCAHLERSYKITLPAPGAGEPPDIRSLHTAFAQFLRFLKVNLNGQTNIRVDQAWASQSATVTGFTRFAPPDALLREEELPEALPRICATLGIVGPPPVATQPFDPALAGIYDADIEALTRAAYPRDYLNFGFTDWGSQAA